MTLHVEPQLLRPLRILILFDLDWPNVRQEPQDSGVYRAQQPCFGDPCVRLHSMQWCSGKSGIIGTLSPWRAREREPITGVWEQSPQWGPGAEPLVRGSGSETP